MSDTKNPLHKAFGITASELGEIQWQPNSDVNLQVIGLGLPRTGTGSLREALQMLGFGPVHHGIELFRRPDHQERMIEFLQYMNAHPEETRHPSRQTVARMHTLMKGYRSSLDGPVCDWITELPQAYPEAKFILTVRDTPEVWWQSWSESVGVHFLNEEFRYKVYRALISSVRFIRRLDDMAQGMVPRLKRDWGFVGPHMYDQHNQKVRDTVPKEKLLEYNVKEGWDPLCKFLQVDVPDKPFPFINESKAIKAIYLGLQLYGAFTWALYFGAAGCAGYLAMHPDKSWEWSRGIWQWAVQQVGSFRK